MKLMKKVTVLAGAALLLSMAGAYAIHESIGTEGRNLSGQTQHLIGGKGGTQKLIGGEGGKQHLIGGKGGRQHLLGTEGPGEPRRFGTEGSGNPRHLGIVQGTETPLYPQDVNVNTYEEQIGDIRTPEESEMHILPFEYDK